ncbi:unnamed protein product [Phyllotreta striolata]|uniref:ENT domain-containing protein n=1 Tax=Phyllotreta striolata TaxID=444603 RepID=A0A9N9XM52_PHYSR|nr:unnamed protein product [Phyllotreta striolata]
MWPLLLDMTKEESVQNLRNLELEAYSNLVSALRAQGPLNPDKRKLLKATSFILNITQERHKAEVRRAISDEKLNTIAYHVTGHTETLEEWAQEGRRLVPLLTRATPQTIYSALANDASEAAGQMNKMLPLPANTERKRPIITPVTAVVVPETSKGAAFRIPEPPKVEDNKKRKLISNAENTNITPLLLTPKLSRIQQLYRQRSKPKVKELIKKSDSGHLDMVQQHKLIQPVAQSAACSSPQPQYINQRVNVLQNISLQPIKEEYTDHEGDLKLTDHAAMSSIANENHAPKPKIVSGMKPNTILQIKQTSPQPAGPSSDVQKTIKMCPAKKSVAKTLNSGQKLIVASNAQTIPSSSILQRTLQIPFVKNVSIKNIEKFKIVTSNSTSTNLHLTNVTSGTNPVKHKVVTVKTNPASKKVIPFSQLQVLNSKGNIKVLPLGGKIVGKSTSGNPAPLYIVNTTQQITRVTHSPQIIATNKAHEKAEVKVTESAGESACRENGKSSVLEDILKASGVIEENNAEDYDAKIEEFHIPQVKKNNNVEIECDDRMDTVEEGINDVKNDGANEAGLVEEKVINDEQNLDEDVKTQKPEGTAMEKSKLENESESNSVAEEITTTEVPVDIMMDIPESKISDTECN